VYLLDEERMAEYYGHGDELNMSFNFSFLWAPWDATVLRAKILATLNHLRPREAWPTWVLSNHDVTRHRQRYGGSEQVARLAAVMLLTLPGTPFMYQGEELGLIDAVIPPDRVVDVDGRDGCRAPVPWTPTPDHGWPHDPWLPFVDAAAECNVATQREQPNSMLHLYRDLLRLRHDHPALQTGDFTMIERDDNVLAYRRSLGEQVLTIAINLGDEPARVDESVGQRVLLATAQHDAATPIDGTLPPQSALISAST